MKLERIVLYDRTLYASREVVLADKLTCRLLPEIGESFTRSFTGEELANHYGSQKASGATDPTVPLPPAAQSR